MLVVVIEVDQENKITGPYRALYVLVKPCVLNNSDPLVVSEGHRETVLLQLTSRVRHIIFIYCCDTGVEENDHCVIDVGEGKITHSNSFQVWKKVRSLRKI